MYLYHYTSKSALHQILDDGIVYMSDKNRKGTNYRHGPGVYLTSLSPENTTNKLKQNNRDGLRNPKFDDRLQAYLKFDIEDLVPYVEKVETKGDRDVWRYSKNIDLSKISYYYNEDTNSGSQREILKQPTVPSSHYAEMYSRQNSSQLQQEQQESGTFGATAGIAAVSLGILGAAALGLIIGFSRRNNNQQ